MKRIIILLFILVCCSALVFADGTCSLDKYDYFPGERAVFSCSCTSGLEENANGYIVWRNSTAYVLQNQSFSTGACKSSLATNSYTFLSGTNFTGNVTFETVNAAWQDVADTVADTFNVTGASINDCLITNLVGDSDGYDLGVLGSVTFVVEDAITGNPIINSHCYVIGKDVDGTPLVVEPYDLDFHSLASSSGGRIAFQHDMVESFWSTNTSYIFDIGCNCLHNETGHTCHDETTGVIVGFKTCTAQAVFTTSNNDYRTYPVNWGLAILVVGVLFFLLLLSQVFKNSNKWFHQGIRLLLTIICVWILVIAGSLGINFARSIQASNAVVGTMNAFYFLLVYFAWVFSFLITIYFIYEVISSFRMKKEDQENDILGR